MNLDDLPKPGMFRLPAAFYALRHFLRHPTIDGIVTVLLLLVLILNINAAVYNADSDPQLLTLWSVIGVGVLSFVLGMRVMLRVLHWRAREPESFGVHVVQTDSGWTAIITEHGNPIHSIFLPEDYDPNEDGGMRLQQLVLEWMHEHGRAPKPR